MSFPPMGIWLGDGAESRLNGVSAQLDIAREVNCFAILARTIGINGHHQHFMKNNGH